ncbi:hypothetical protein ACEN19_05865 [Corynebacterium auriscanis]
MKDEQNQLDGGWLVIGKYELEADEDDRQRDKDDGCGAQSAESGW